MGAEQDPIEANTAESDTADLERYFEDTVARDRRIEPRPTARR
jgi:hypothetical protein